MVLHGGYGQALFVTHTNGFTSVYGHVVSFAPKIQEYVRKYQYEHETFVCDIRIEPDVLPIEKGEMIALSGNEGSSAGPHLHLELRRNDNGDYVDPMPYFRKYLKDDRSPVASLIGLYPVRGRGVVDGSSRRKLVGAGNLKQRFTAWGEIYTGIAAKDYMSGTSNFYGVHSVTLYVDSVQVFRSVTDEVSANENRMINGFIDYPEYAKTRRLVMRSYKAPGNSLRLLETGDARGIVTIDEERDYHFRYVLEDNFGNKRSYRFTVSGKRQDIPAYESQAKRVLHWNQTNVVQEPGMNLIVPKAMVYEDTELDTRVVSAWLLSVGNRRAPFARSRYHEILHRATGGQVESIGGRNIRQRLGKGNRPYARYIFGTDRYGRSPHHSLGKRHLAYEPQHTFPGERCADWDCFV